MADRHYRKIKKNIDAKYKLQFASMTLKLKSNETKIENNKNDISTNLKKIDNFTQYILKDNHDFEESYNIDKQIFRFNKNKRFYKIFEKTINYDFTINSSLSIKNDMFYKYDNLLNSYYKLQHKYDIYDSENNKIYTYLFNKDDFYKNSNHILNTTEDFCICFKKNILKLQ